MDRLALIILILGGINLGLMGFQLNLSTFFGGMSAPLPRIFCILVGLSALYSIRTLLILFRTKDENLKKV